MSSWIEPPPPRQGMGCFGKGCLILVCFFLLLAVAFVIGAFMASRTVVDEYLAKEPMSLEPSGVDTTATPTGPVDEPPAGDFAAPAPTPDETITDVPATHRDWKGFEKAAKRGEPARIEMTEGELNALFDTYSHLRGRLRAELRGNRGVLRVSYPTSEIPFINSVLKDRYINVEGVVVAAADGSPTGATFESLKVNNQPMAIEIMDRQYGTGSINDWKAEFSRDHHLTRFNILDGKLILEANMPR